MNQKETNPFKMLTMDKDVPVGLKKRVMNDVRLAHLIGDIADLFTTKFVGTLSKMIDPESGGKGNGKKMPEE